MKSTLPATCRVIAALVVVALLPAGFSKAQAQGQGYQTPNFAGMAATQQAPIFPASPLAGGPAAAGGSEFIDAHGKPIIMQTGYGEPYQGGYCQGGYCGSAGGCPPGAGGYSDPMAVDFGGYGQEQCGPHYFDVSADVVFLSSVDQFDGIGAFGAVGPAANAPRILDPSTSGEDYEPGWRIAARYDIGALAVLEATYMGLYDIGFSDRAVSENVSVPPGQPNQLVSVFSNFGQNPINGLDQGAVYSLDYKADLQSTEISYRRYWVGNNPRVSGTWLLGARYLRFTDDLVFGADAFVDGANQFSSRSWSSENDLVGFQFGGDGWISLRQGLRIGCEGKSGIYNNRFKMTNKADFATGTGVPADFDVTSEGNQVAFAAEGGVTMVADILPSWSIKGGYQVLYMNSLATAGGNVVTSDVNNTAAILSQEDALFHGFHGGFEYIW